MRTAPLPDNFFGEYRGTERQQENYRARQSAALDQGLEPCITCGRGVAEGKGFIVVVTNGGGSLLHPEDDGPEAQADPGYMGGYVVGSTCVRGVPAEYRTPWEG